MGILHRVHRTPTRVVLLLVTIAASLLLSADLALGQGGALVLYTDATYTSCNAVTFGAGFVNVHVVHEYASAKGSRFALENKDIPSTLTWILDQFPIGSPNSATGGGSTQVGWEVDYGGCQPAPHPVCIAWYQDTSGVPGRPGECGQIWLGPDRADPTGRITCTDCSDRLQFLPRYIFTINGGATCPCGEP